MAKADHLSYTDAVGNRRGALVATHNQGDEMLVRREPRRIAEDLPDARTGDTAEHPSRPGRVVSLANGRTDSGRHHTRHKVNQT